MSLDKVVLITGASSGIGAGIARELAAAGTTLMLGARRTDRLDALAEELRSRGARVETRRLDVTDRADVAGFAKAAQDAFGRVDAVVNNAGIMPLSPLHVPKVEEWDAMVDVNIKGVLYGIAAVLPEMTARGSGHIVNIASIGALNVVPTAAVYCATKFAVRAISDGLRQERDDIRVTCIHPGVVESRARLDDHRSRDRRGDADLARRGAAAGRHRPGGAFRAGTAGRRRRQRDRRSPTRSAH